MPVKRASAESGYVLCRMCQHSELVKYSKEDPVLAICKARSVMTAIQGGTCEYRNPVEVASTKRHCELYAKAKGTKAIELINKSR